MITLAGFANIGRIPELRQRFLFTLGMLAVYRVGIFVTIPGVDREVMKAVISKQGGGLLGLFNMFSGGGLGNLSIFALGIMPYVTASIVFQLFTMVFKPLDDLRKEGEQGYRKINQYTRYATIVLALLQGFFIATGFEGVSNQDLGGSAMGEVVLHGGWSFRLMSMLTLTTGTAFMMWVGEQITERGIGNGISLIIFAGIVTDIPAGVINYFKTNQGNIQPLNVAAVVLIILMTVATVVFFEGGQRRIPIFYARRTVGRRIYGGHQAHLPLRVNTAGTIPPIFASSLLMFPATLANYKIPGMADLQAVLQRGDWLFNVLYVFLIVFFCYFYTAVTFQAVEVADNLKKQQAFIPNIRQGKQTANYIDAVLTKITLGGALYVAAVCVVPSIVGGLFRVPFRWGGTSIMIVVGVALDTVNQIEAYLISRNYDGLSDGGGHVTKVHGRRT
ncbi:preprotein translocase subunit SecY [Pajaroellobacter abortibovis]|uniref:Protein translocase subunit SecY n=1 Tax=Pajaroellobacter abortibovis TaxID=1882918 RepID=A0A1L6MYD7_9BACT|nr:preprotein translocase subunit SecY [Pajaroellobacter abortibovis]APS00415.1 preprotein translocase subunit SecY [Pajaroellobacter abortibovis]